MTLRDQGRAESPDFAHVMTVHQAVRMDQYGVNENVMTDIPEPTQRTAYKFAGKESNRKKCGI